MLKRFSCYAVIIALSLSAAGCARDFVTGKKVYNAYSLDSEVKLGSYVMNMQLNSLKSAKKEYDSAKNGKQLAMIRDMVSKITAVSHYPNYPYEVHLADVDIVNAWCAPGGKIMVYEGLWDPKKGLIKKDNQDELAAVLAHEIAHATARHLTEAMTRNMTILIIGQIATEIISASSSVGGNIFQQIFTEGFNIFVPTYGRKNEFEADRLGMIYMAKAGYDPRAAVAVWERVAKTKGDRTSIYATHPSSGARAKELNKYLPEAIQYYEEAKMKGRVKKAK
jgi:predicted Zn-dependent protease